MNAFHTKFASAFVMSFIIGCFNPNLSQFNFKCTDNLSGSCPDGQRCINNVCGNLTGFTGFAVSQTAQTGNFPDRIATGDFNGDGKLDLIISYSIAKTIALWLGNGDGTFKERSRFIVNGAGTLQATPCDLNSDLRLDLVVSSEPLKSVLVYLGDGNGVLGQPRAFPASSPYWSAAGDLNGDKKADIVVANGQTSEVSTFLGNGDGTIRLVGNYPAGTNPSSLALADITGDGVIDAITANFTSGDASVHPGDGHGGLLASGNHATSGKQNGVIVADFNNDGKIDIASSDGIDSAINLLISTGRGQFAPVYRVSAAGIPTGIAIADFDIDGNYDIACAVTPGNVSVLLGNGDGTFNVPKLYSVGQNPVFLVTGDWNGDSRTDVAVTNSTENSFTVLLNTAQ